MTRPTDAVVIGFTKNTELSRRAFEPLLDLRQQGVLRDIHYVTWDSAEIDKFVAPVNALNGVRIARVPQPEASGNRNQRGLVYQTRNLEAAFARVAEPDALLVKLRPDYIFRTGFLKTKLQGFDRLCAKPAVTAVHDVAMPPSPFERKIWIAWADANQPFFHDDAAFIGLKSDLLKLIGDNVESRLPLLEELSCGSLVHVLRYAPAFLPLYPMFERYIAEYSGFINDMDYRRKLMSALLQDTFFWHLLIAHAWILYTSFHIDCGRAGDIAFYPNTINASANWTDLSSIKLAPPFDHVDKWRSGTNAGSEALPALTRVYGRLMDDAWPRALFTKPMSDLPEATLCALMRGVAYYRNGHLARIEDAFYAKLAAFRRKYQSMQQAA
jgi:hypothetical protein